MMSLSWNPTRARQGLWLLSALSITVTIVVILFAFVLPYDLPRSENGSSRPADTKTETTNNLVPSQEAFAVVWDKDLRRPLFDVPPLVQAVTPSAPPPSLAIKLVGTVIEGGRDAENDKAIFLTNDGKMEFKTVGELSGGAQVLKIQLDSVAVRYNGQTVTLKIEKGPG